MVKGISFDYESACVSDNLSDIQDFVKGMYYYDQEHGIQSLIIDGREFEISTETGETAIGFEFTGQNDISDIDSISIIYNYQTDKEEYELFFLQDLIGKEFSYI